jgi:hypothetical protein
MFNSESAKKAGKKSKRGPAKKKEPGIEDKLELLYEKVVDNLLENLDKLSEADRLKLFVNLSNKIKIDSKNDNNSEFTGPIQIEVIDNNPDDKNSTSA